MLMVNPVHLTATEYKIMELLMSNPGRVFPAEEIYERFGRNRLILLKIQSWYIFGEFVKRLRSIPKQPKYLKVVWGIGYKIEKDDSKY